MKVGVSQPEIEKKLDISFVIDLIKKEMRRCGCPDDVIEEQLTYINEKYEEYHALWSTEEIEQLIQQMAHIRAERYKYGIEHKGKDMSRTSFAKLVGVSPTSIEYWEKGSRQITRQDHLSRLSRVCGCPEDYLSGKTPFREVYTVSPAPFYPARSVFHLMGLNQEIVWDEKKEGYADKWCMAIEKNGEKIKVVVPEDVLKKINDNIVGFAKTMENTLALALACDPMIAETSDIKH